jgi:hypothetical protein
MVSDQIKEDPKISIAKAETVVKSSNEWRQWIEGMVRAERLQTALASNAISCGCSSASGSRKTQTIALHRRS